MQLQPRQKAILAAVIERYVETAEPVGSSALVADARVMARIGNVSSATIRNELAELESLGLLSHPHTSAGRVPTDAGYRVYVNELLKPRPVKARERAQIEAGIHRSSGSIEDALRDACTALAQITGYPAVATLPSARRDSVRHVQLNPVPPHRLLLALVTQSGRIEHRLFDVSEDVSATNLNTVVNFLNQQLAGLSISRLRALQFSEVSAGLHGEAVLALAARAFDFVRQSAGELNDERVVVQGMVTLLNEPEFSDIDEARAAMRLFEDRMVLADVLQSPFRDAQVEGYAVVIGREHPAENVAVQRFSLVGIAYGVGGQVLGSVGVLGPTRMKYADAVSVVPALAARLQDSLESW